MAEFMTGFTRTHYCGELRLSDVGKEVTVCGWVQRQRDLGQLIFIDLRDRTGILQLAFDDSTDRTIFKSIYSSCGICIGGKRNCKERSAKNMELPTGEVEIAVAELRVLAKVKHHRLKL